TTLPETGRNEGDPHVLRSVCLGPVGPPVGSRPATAMIRRDEQMCVVSIVRLRLDPRPELAHVPVYSGISVEYLIVAAIVRRVAGLVERDVQDAGPYRRQVMHRQTEGEGVVADAVPRRTRLLLDLVEHPDAGVIGAERFDAGVDQRRAFDMFGDRIENAPRR